MPRPPGHRVAGPGHPALRGSSAATPATGWDTNPSSRDGVGQAQHTRNVVQAVTENTGSRGTAAHGLVSHAAVRPQAYDDKMARIPYLGPPKCVGSGVPGDWFEHGHYILPGTQPLICGGHSDTSGRVRFRSRCRLCASTRRYWKRDKDAAAKAAQAHLRHADWMVSKGQARDRAIAIDMMNGGGVTVAWLAQQFLDAIGKPCPGLCFDPAVVDGKPLARDHIITRMNELQLDWRDPRYPICPENAGPLEGTCNQQKAGKPWAEFMNSQRATRRNFLEAVRLPPPPIQGELDLGLS